MPSESEPVVVVEGDCLEVLPHLAGIDAVITDPPYGMDWNTDSKRYSGGKRKRGVGRDDWGDIGGDAEPFDPSPWLEFPSVVLWGYHHFAERVPVGTVLVWLKKADHLFGTFLSDCELAWMKGGHGVYAHRKQFPPPSRIVEGGGECAHPTQKPVCLMRWCIQKAKVPSGGIILDPFAGSGTTGVAAIAEGRRAILIEKEPKYAEIARRRIAEAMGLGRGSLLHSLPAASLFPDEGAS